MLLLDEAVAASEAIYLAGRRGMQTVGEWKEILSALPDQHKDVREALVLLDVLILEGLGKELVYVP